MIKAVKRRMQSVMKITEMNRNPLTKQIKSAPPGK